MLRDFNFVHDRTQGWFCNCRSFTEQLYDVSFKKRFLVSFLPKQGQLTGIILIIGIDDHNS